MTTIVAIALICCALYLVLRSALSVAHLVVLSLLPICLGYWFLVREGQADATTAIWFTVSLGVIAGGYFLTANFDKRPVGLALKLGQDHGRSCVLALLLFSGCFTVLHFVLGGIPILSESVETSRFEFNNSGLLGIPGRMYLFGLPLATGAALARSRQLNLHWYADPMTRVAVLGLVISRLLAGFKGGLLEIVVVLIAVTILTRGPVTSVARTLRRFFPLAVFAVLWVFIAGSLYNSYRTSEHSLPELLWERSTTKAALPGVLVLERKIPFAPSSSIDLDATYFGGKYFSIGPGVSYSFGRLVASTIFQVNPESSAYTAPVTYGAFPELTYNFGLPIGLIGMLSLGALLSLAGISRRPISLAGFVVRLVLVVAIYDFATKGGLVYLLINWIAASVILLVAGRFVEALMSGYETKRPPIDLIRLGQVAGSIYDERS